jgi:SnoaL-like domain
MPTDDTTRVARGYYDAWTNRKGPDALRDLMAEEFTFDSAIMRIEGREQFLAGAGASGWPESAATTLLAEAYDGEHAFQLYTGSNGDKTVKIAEHLVIREGRLLSSEVVVDAGSFMEFMAG